MAGAAVLISAAGAAGVKRTRLGCKVPGAPPLAGDPKRAEPIVGSLFSGDGHTRDVIREYDGRACGNLQYVPGMVGQGFAFDGRTSAIAVPDHEGLRLDRSVTLSAWVRADSYPGSETDYGQLIFRGDDRGGTDPYFLGLRHNGLLVFAVDSGTEYADVKAPLPLGKFVKVVATLDHASGLMRLLFDDKVVAQSTTHVRPLRDLDPNANPGIGIGNHASRPDSIWSQPFHGVLDEVTISAQTTLVPQSVSLSRAEDRRDVGFVTLAVPAPPGGAEVTLQTTGKGVQIQRQVLIPAGERSAPFDLHYRLERVPVTVTALYNGIAKTVTSH